ncbi:MAG TPA: hypothetical protein VHC69_23850 [Polyangiaceae bacterium]|nr:hypothetical protein [Polyangiaceae bacterium]
MVRIVLDVDLAAVHWISIAICETAPTLDTRAAPVPFTRVVASTAIRARVTDRRAAAIVGSRRIASSIH